MRKTIQVKAILQMYAVNCIARPEDHSFSQVSPEEEIANLNASLEGASKLIVSILHTTGMYKGFMYIDRNGKACGLDHPDFFEHRRQYFTQGD